MRIWISVVVATIASAASADVFTDTFTDGVNHGGWSFITEPSIETFPKSGGNPGHYLHIQDLDTSVPVLRSSGASVFTGDYRARGVTSLEIDLRNLSIETLSHPTRPVVVLLVYSNGTAALTDDVIYFSAHAEVLPDYFAGWKRFAFEIPSEQMSAPAGWTLVVGPDAPAGVGWNEVITDVGEVRFGTYRFGTQFPPFAEWGIGADNVTIRTPPKCPADFNGDGATTGADLSVLLGQFGSNVTPGSGADANDDGVVDGRDLSVLLGSFGCGT